MKFIHKMANTRNGPDVKMPTGNIVELKTNLFITVYDFVCLIYDELIKLFKQTQTSLM